MKNSILFIEILQGLENHVRSVKELVCEQLIQKEEEEPRKPENAL